MNERFEYSVVIPVYNGEINLLKAIRSVISQTTIAREIIIVDDASTVDLTRCLNAFPVKLIRHSENKGTFQARITGIKESSCNFIFFLDSDDVWDNNHAEVHEKLWKEFENENIAQISTILKPQLNASDTKAINAKNEKLIKKGQRKVGITELLANNPLYNSASSFQKLALQNIIDMNTLNIDVRYCEDLLVSLILVTSGSNVVINPRVTGEYNLAGDRKSTHHFLILYSFYNIMNKLFTLNNQKYKVKTSLLVGSILFKARWLVKLFRIHASHNSLVEALDGQLVNNNNHRWLNLLRNIVVYIALSKLIWIGSLLKRK